ncbi:MAG: ribonuclease R [Desulfuromonadia bacterium]
MPVDPATVIAHINSLAARRVTVTELATRLGLRCKDRDRLRHLLDRMVRKRILIRDERGGYLLPGAVRGSHHIGVVFPHREGYGFVRIEGEEDLFIPARQMKGVLPGDRVEVSRVTGRFGKKEGRILRIVERSTIRIVGRYDRGKNGWGRIVPDDPRIHPLILVRPGDDGGARDGEVVSAELVEGGKGDELHARIVRVIGMANAPDVEILSIVERLGIPDRFSDEALLEASRTPSSVAASDLAGRNDLRNLPFVTIDGETARDFDDAVAIERIDKGYRLYVSIADVSHYVREGSFIDRDAYERGTSVYFPDRCIPMLPEELSNGICSLNPGVDRLAMTAEMEFDRMGRRVAESFYPSVIRSVMRLTYTEVSRGIEGQDPTVRERLSPVLSDLETMGELAKLLAALRRARGSIDFDLPEAEVVIGLTGTIDDVVKRERTLAHRLIEEFMLAANEAVATFVSARGVPFLYRIHEPPAPEKLEGVRELFSTFGITIPNDPREIKPQQLQSILEESAGKPCERVVNELLLRSMKQARYSPENAGHFGLASGCYTHFTSPIRRYPDLVVHRILKSVTGASPHPLSTRPLAEVGEQTSRRERVAMDAEREVLQLMKIRFMQDKIGSSFTGIVTSVTPYGLYVELDEWFVEGMVHVTLLPPGFYHFDERTHALVGERSRVVFRIGDPVTVRVVAASLEKRQIDFLMEEHRGISTPLPPPRISATDRPAKGKSRGKGKGAPRRGGRKRG